MQFSTIFVAIFATMAMATPAIMERDTASTDSVTAAAQAYLDAKEYSGCQKAKCVLALSPTIVSCGAAALEEGLNPIADATCLANISWKAIKRPAACDGC